MINQGINCTGCNACMQICPVNAIEMVENNEGFLYPKVDEVKCIQCGKCNRHCHLNHPNRKECQSDAYAAIANDTELLKNSTSGGVFISLAAWFIAHQGAVVGCVYDENLYPHHQIAYDMETVQKMQGSKYVESDLGNIYEQTEKLLKQEQYVLFSGTGCQVAGLKAFLNREYDNLFALDFVCHGVPSRKLFMNHISYIGKQDRITDYVFRSKKEKDWGELHFRYMCESGKHKAGMYYEDFYYRHFLGASGYRESCYQCKYANTERISDLTMGDYWGVEKIHPELPLKQGVSAILANTEKAKRFIAQGHLSMKLVNSEVEKMCLYQTNLVSPSQKPKCRKYFYVLLKGNLYDVCATMLKAKRKIRRWLSFLQLY